MSKDSPNENLLFIVNELKNYFDSNDWMYEYDAERQCFTGGISLDGPLGSTNFIVFAHEDHAVCYHILPVSAKIKERPLQAEFLTRVNYNLARGCFEMDFSDGEIRYKHRISLADIKENSSEEISDMVYLGCFMLEQYGPGIVAISFGRTPEEAYLDCAADDDEDGDKN
ncbi:MAG: YbjN domain-containing protein [Lentisphaeria bacterium]|nr:YbjN domain-containing protein [Lentisphaeria bacterium]